MLPAPLEESVTTARALKARRRIGIGVLGVLLAAGVASCGGTRQDANEPEGNFPVSIVSADFPNKQQLAQNTNLTLSVANAGDKTIPDLAITIFTTPNATTSETGGSSGGPDPRAGRPPAGESGGEGHPPTHQAGLPVPSPQG